MFFDELSPYKQELYEAFREHVGMYAMVDIFFHHCDIRFFKTLLDKADYYNFCVVMPFESKDVSDILKCLEPSKLLILDRVEHVRTEHSFVGQDHHQGLYDALESAVDLFGKYRKVYLVMPEPGEVAIHSGHAPSVIPPAVKRFCARHKKPCAIVREVKNVKRGDAWFVIDDADLVAVVVQAHAKELKLGRDLGVLAYNETAMRQIVAEGITVVSTDFREMGRMAADYILNPRKLRITVPTRMIRTASTSLWQGSVMR